MTKHVVLEKQVGFERRVDIMAPGWPIAILPDHIFGADRVTASGELQSSQTSLLKLSSSNGLYHSGRKSNYNYGYSTADRPNKLGLLLLSSDDGYDSGKDGWKNWAWIHDKQRRWTVACWASIALLSLLILAVFAMILTWCIIIPRRPNLGLLDQVIPVQSLEVSPHALNTSSGKGVGGDGQVSASFSANFTLQLLVKNPNRVSTDYSSSTFYVAYNNSVLGEGTLSAFSQKAHATTQQSVELLVANQNVSQENAVSLLTGANVTDTIPLEVNGQLQARLKILGLSTPPVLIKLWCTVDIKVSQQEVTNQQCSISNHKLIW